MPRDTSIPALLPHDLNGHQFVVYGDSCSGVPGAIHEETTAAVNQVVARLDPPPEFVCFLGDEVIGLTTNEVTLREQWRFWFDTEMAWLDTATTPLYHTTANHTTYDAMSERVYAEVMAHLPANGPADQQHLSYFVRRDDLLMVFVNTMWTELGEGRVETAWLERVLTDQTDARSKLVFGHHPVFPINGFGGEYQREIEHANGRRFWEVLVRHQVMAYWCSHMLAFDTQVHDGVLQIMTAGAGTKHRMPEESEYLHAVQVSLDADGLRYQVLDVEGTVRESLEWPLVLSPTATWQLPATNWTLSDESLVRVWNISGVCPDGGGGAQTFVSGWSADEGMPPLWIGLVGPEMRLGVLLAPQIGRSPHFRYGPTLEVGQPFSVQVALHRGLGPGGILWRWADDAPWSSMSGASSWGCERLPAISRLSIGCARNDTTDRPFRGTDLRVTTTSRS